MSIGLLKRLLLLLNVVAILVIASAAYGFVSHRGEIQESWSAPDFAVPTLRPPGANIRIEQISLQLGRFPKPEVKTDVEETTERKEIESVLAQLGTITNAIVVYEPYDDIVPAIIFKMKQGGGIRTIRVGEALETRPHAKYGTLSPQPVRYKFVGCEPDPRNEDWTYFIFDMYCDGKDLQKAHWKREGEEAEKPQPATNVPSGPSTAFEKGKYMIGEGDDEPVKTQPVKTPDRPGEKPVVPVEPAPFVDRPGTLFEEDGKTGSLALTDDGMDYLRDNYEKVLKEARTSTYKDPKTKRAAGVRIVAIKRGSVANEFGIRADDIIISINDRPVFKQLQAVNIVKSELNKKNIRYIRVKLKRQGRELEKRFDTRDRNVRNKAKDAFRDRR